MNKDYKGQYKVILTIYTGFMIALFIFSCNEDLGGQLFSTILLVISAMIVGFIISRLFFDSEIMLGRQKLQEKHMDK